MEDQGHHPAEEDPAVEPIFLSSEYDVPIEGGFVNAVLAFDNTLVVMTYSYEEGIDKRFLRHMKMDGTTLWKYEVNETIFSFEMLTDRQVIIINSKNNTIELIDLSTRHVQHIRHTFMFPRTSLHLNVFPQTQLVCLLEYNSWQYMRITYYSLRELILQSKPVAEYSKTIRTIWGGFSTNQHSQVYWQQPENQGDGQICYFYDLRTTPTGTCSKFDIKDLIFEESLQIIPRRPRLYIKQQLLEGCYLVQIFQVFHDNLGVFILDTRGSVPVIKDSNFRYAGRPLSSYSLLEVVVERVGDFLLLIQWQQAQIQENFFDTDPNYNYRIFCCKISEGEIVSIQPVYKNDSKCTVTWERNCYLQSKPEQNHLFLKLHDLSFTIKEIHLHLLLHLHEDLDDDLLYDAVSLLQ